MELCCTKQHTRHHNPHQTHSALEAFMQKSFFCQGDEVDKLGSKNKNPHTDDTRPQTRSSFYLMVWERARIPRTKKYMESNRLMYS